MLFLMIALQGLSQVKYIINNDTIVGYNKFENRRLAVLLEERNMYKELYKNDSAIVEYQRLIIIEHIKQLQNTNNQIINLEMATNKLIINNRGLIIENDRLNKSNKVFKTITISSTTISTILLILLIL